MVSFSVSSLAFFATFPHLFAIFLFSSKFSGSSFSEISVVTFSQSIVKISSKSVILSLKFTFDFLGKFLKFLYSLGVIQKVALLISAVKIEYSSHSFTHLAFHSSVNSCLIAIPLSLLSIQDLE